MDYIEDQIRDRIVREIEGLELPPEWRPRDVIRYVIKIIKKGNI